MITKENYEAFILDYFEGNLSAESTAELMLFLEQHPSLKEEFESFENITLEEAAPIVFSSKDNLKKQVASGPLKEDDYIGYVERTLNPLEVKAFEERINKNTAYAKELSLYKKTILPPENIIYTEKDKLKRGKEKIVSTYYYVAMAASVALIITASFLFFNQEENNNTVSSKTTTNTSTKTLPVAEKKINNNTLAAASQTIEASTNKTTSANKKNASINTGNTNNTTQELFASVEPLVKRATNIVLTPTAEKINTALVEIPQIKTYAANNEQSDYLSIPQLIRKKVGVNPVENETEKMKNEKLNKWDLIAIGAKLINKNANVKASTDTTGNTMGYYVAIGNIEVSRGRVK